ECGRDRVPNAVAGSRTHEKSIFTRGEAAEIDLSLAVGHHPCRVGTQQSPGVAGGVSVGEIDGSIAYGYIVLLRMKFGGAIGIGYALVSVDRNGSDHWAGRSSVWVDAAGEEIEEAAVTAVVQPSGKRIVKEFGRQAGDGQTVVLCIVKKRFGPRVEAGKTSFRHHPYPACRIFKEAAGVAIGQPILMSIYRQRAGGGNETHQPAG